MTITEKLRHNFAEGVYCKGIRGTHLLIIDIEEIEHEINNLQIEIERLAHIINPKDESVHLDED